MLNSVAIGNAWGHGPSTSITETAIAEATGPPADAGWTHAIDRRYITGEAPGAQPAGVQFDASTAQQPHSPLRTWTVWGGQAIHQPNWALQLSAHAPPALLQDITFEMTQGQSVRRVPPTTPDGPALRTAQAPDQVTASPPVAPPAPRTPPSPQHPPAQAAIAPIRATR
ncbi:DUF317 domain-containing protein [Streptomyces sp. NPDC050619]|uniref:DUF317 domain-containing protein n=1 Tax=Streptomyces sp. NPDC050619 TaxID=3157214 RepID=UPI003429BE76